MRIKEIMKEKGITQAELANRMGIAQSTLSVLLKNPTLSTLQRIAYTLKVEIEELFDNFNDYEKQIYKEHGDEIRQMAVGFLQKEIEEDKKRKLQTFTFICPHCGKEIPLKIDTEALNGKG